MKRFLFSLIIVPICVFAEGGLPDRPYIYVEGRAEIQKNPDVVTLKFDVVGSAPDQSKANEEVQSKANKTFAMLKERKIADNDVIAENLHAYPEFEQEENYGHRRDKVIGYSVTRPFEVKVRDVAMFPKLVDELIALGGVQFSEIEGALSKQAEIEEQLKDKALTNARERADKTAKAMAVRIESAFAISTAPFPEIHGKMFEAKEKVIVTGSIAPPSHPPAPEYHLAPITVSQSVHVIYLISPAK